MQEGVDSSLEVVYVGGLPVDVPIAAQDVRSQSFLPPQSRLASCLPPSWCCVCSG